MLYILFLWLTLFPATSFDPICNHNSLSLVTRRNQQATLNSQAHQKALATQFFSSSAIQSSYLTCGVQSPQQAVTQVLQCQSTFINRRLSHLGVNNEVTDDRINDLPITDDRITDDLQI